MLFDTTPTQSCATIKTNNRYNYSIRHLHISHNARYPPPPPPKFCVTFVFHFSWVLQLSQEKLKTVLMQNFGGQIRCIMGDVQVSYLFINFLNCRNNIIKNTILSNNILLPKKREKEEKLFSEVAREEEKFHKRLYSSSTYCTLSNG